MQLSNWTELTEWLASFHMPTVYLPCYSICPNHLPAHFFLSCVYFANIYYLKIFPLVCHLFYHSLNNAFPRAKVLVLMKSNLSIYIFVDDVFDIIYKKVWLIQDHKYFLLCFCLKYSILHKRYSVFTFKSIIHFELTTVYCITYGSKFFYILISMVPSPLVKEKKRKFFFYWISPAISSKVNWPYVCIYFQIFYPVLLIQLYTSVPITHCFSLLLFYLFFLLLLFYSKSWDQVILFFLKLFCLF